MAFDPAALLAAVLHLGIALLFGLATVWAGVRAFDRMTPGLDELAELRKGNLAVGLVLAAVVVAIALVIRGGLVGLAGAGTWEAAGLALLRLLIAFGIALLTVRLALWAFDQLTATIDDAEALAQGNLGVAALLAGSLVAVALVVAAAVERVLAAVVF